MITSRITYQPVKQPIALLHVKLDGKKVGHIVQIGGKYAYLPKGQKNVTGGLFDSVSDVKVSIEG